MDVGVAVGVTENTVWAWERGRNAPRAEYLCALASVLGCTLDALFEDKDDAPGAVVGAGASRPTGIVHAFDAAVRCAR